jgi:peroxiredoxin
MAENPTPKKLNPVILLFLIFPLMGILAALALIGNNKPATTPEPPPVTYVAAVGLIGKPAPDFTLGTLGNETVKLSDYRGQWVILNFWATWCSPCKDEMPIFQSFERGGFGDYRGSATLLAVDYHEDPNTVKAWLKDQKLDLPIVLDPDSTAITAYGVGELPQTFIIDPNGVVQAKVLGAMTPDRLKSYLANVATEF